MKKTSMRSFGTTDPTRRGASWSSAGVALDGILGACPRSPAGVASPATTRPRLKAEPGPCELARWSFLRPRRRLSRRRLKDNSLFRGAGTPTFRSRASRQRSARNSPPSRTGPFPGPDRSCRCSPSTCRPLLPRGDRRRLRRELPPQSPIRRPRRRTSLDCSRVEGLRHSRQAVDLNFVGQGPQSSR